MKVRMGESTLRFKPRGALGVFSSREVNGMRDEDYMKIALKLARKGLGWVNPNPPVGAVLVKDGEIVSKGYHRHFGGRHAEREAIEKALEKGVSLEGATLYVTLEPCDHFGKTPPCTEAILEAGIRKVVIACRDPNPVSGDGVKKLAENGVEVVLGVCEREAKELMKFFLKSVTTGLPYVTLKYAATLDGKIADFEGNSKWITAELRPIVHRLRHQHMAVLVGAKTALLDNPRLDVRLPGKWRNPIRVILDREGKTLERVDLNVFAQSGRVIVFTERGRADLPPNVTIAKCGSALEILRTLHGFGIDSVLVEGGSEVFSQFLPHADEIYAFYGVKVFGKGLDVFAGLTQTVDQELDFRIERMVKSKSGKEFLVVMKRCSRA